MATASLTKTHFQFQSCTMGDFSSELCSMARPVETSTHHYDLSTTNTHVPRKLSSHIHVITMSSLRVFACEAEGFKMFTLYEGPRDLWWIQ